MIKLNMKEFLIQKRYGPLLEEEKNFMNIQKKVSNLLVSEDKSKEIPPHRKFERFS